MSSEPEFAFRHPVDVRFSDIDVGAHAHHSRAVLYFEEARMAYWARITGRSGLDSVDFVVAELSVRFHERVLWPQTLDVGVRVSKLGKRHFEMEYEVRSNMGVVLLSGMTVQVMFDFAEGATKKMPPEVRAAIDAFDGPFGPGGRRVAVAGS
jgi:acyl-CoA thioester hydrolase